MIHIEEETTLPLRAQFTSLYDTYAAVKPCGYNYQTILIVIDTYFCQTILRLLSNDTDTILRLLSNDTDTDTDTAVK